MALIFTVLSKEMASGNLSAHVEDVIQNTVGVPAMKFLEHQLSVQFNRLVCIVRDPAHHQLHVRTLEVGEQQTPLSMQSDTAMFMPDTTQETQQGTLITGPVTVGKMKPPRPMNCWMLYRDSAHKELKKLHPNLSVQEICKLYSAPLHFTSVKHFLHPTNSFVAVICSKDWKALSPAQKEHWKAEAKMAKEEHQRLFPGYKYNPRKAGDIKKRQSRKVARNAATNVATTLTAAMADTTSMITATSRPEIFDFNSFPDASELTIGSDMAFASITVDSMDELEPSYTAESLRQARLEDEFGAEFTANLSIDENIAFRDGADESATLPPFYHDMF